MARNAIIVKYIAPVIVGVLSVLFIGDLISIFQNFYYHQNWKATDFLPGAGFFLALSFLLFITFIAQLTLFQFLYKLEKLVWISTAIVGVSILAGVIYFLCGKSFEMGVFYAAGFLVYSIVNFFVNKSLSLVLKK